MLKIITQIFIFVLLPFLSISQTVITGTITDGETNDLLYGVNVIPKEDQSTGVTSDFDGNYSITVKPEWTTLIFSYIGFEKVEVPINGQTVIDVTLGGSSYNLDQVVISASKKKEKILNAPASVSVISAERIQNQTSLTPIDNLKKTPGVDIMSTGLVGANVNLRGFNGVFNGTMLTMVDNRIGRVPSLRVNAFQLIPGNSYDIEKIEIVRGPGSALYGPNAADGVMHMITKSPIDIKGKQETTVSMTTGFRNVILDAPAAADFEKGDLRIAYKPEFRTAIKFSDNFGMKLSGKYLTGQDWEYYDAREPVIGQPIYFGTVKNGELWQKDLTDKYHEFVDDIEILDSAGNVIGTRQNTYSKYDRNFDINNWNGDARFDFRFGNDSEIILATGISSTENLELTGLGAAQSVGWTYSYGQARARFGNLFAQYFINSSNAGQDTYLIPQGSNPDDTVQMQLLVDKSKLHVVQMQHSADINKLKLIYGLDFLATRPESDGTINGRFENNDNFNQYGGYLQGEYELSPKIKLVAAARSDYHDKIDEFQISPRAALVYKPDPKHTLRATYNKAFATPSNFSLSLDLSNGIHPLWNGNVSNFNPVGSIMEIRGIGNPIGYQYNYDSENELQYHNLWDGQNYSVNNTNNNYIYFENIIDVLVAQLSAAAGITVEQASPLAGILFGYLMGEDGLIQDVDLVGLDFIEFLETGNAASSLFNGTGDLNSVSNYEAQKSETVETYELGYKGIIKDKLYLSVDAYYTQKKNLRSGLLNRSPYVIFNPNQLNDLLGDNLRANLTAADNLAVLAGLGNTITALLEGDPAYAIDEDPNTEGIQTDGDGYNELVKILQDANAQLGLGILTPDNEDGLVDQDMILTYVNLGDVDIFGTDLGFTYVLTDDIQLQGSYSFASKNTLISNQGDTIAFNSPKNKFSLGLDHLIADTGLGYGLNYRWYQGFPANSSVYIGDVESYGSTDIKLFYRPKFFEGFQATVDVNNVFSTFDNILGKEYRSFPGTPNIGRMTFVKLAYTFD